MIVDRRAICAVSKNRSSLSKTEHASTRIGPSTAQSPPETHMIATSSEGASGRVLSGIPRLDIDPFAIEFFENPYPVQAALRDAGPGAHLNKWNVYAVARYAEVRAVLNDPLTFCSGRGGLSDFSKEIPWRAPSLVLEADPPAHTRTRAVFNRVLSPAVMKQIRDGFAAAAEAKVDELVARGSF
jgi:4-methoxybenzoate monooxygenase (O-demethylating)